MSTLKNILEQRGMPCCSGCGTRMKMMEGACPDCGVNYGLSMGAKDAPGMSEAKTEEEPTADFKLDKLGRKIKASKIVFNQGEDDSTKRVQENMKTTYKDMITVYAAMRTEALQLEDEINEVLSKDAAAGDWISDFVHSDNPKFAGKSKEKRKQMALAAYYAKQKNEEVELAETIDAEHYRATSEPSQFGGHRPKVVHKGKGTTTYLGQQGYKTKEAAKAGATAYLNAYEKIGDHAAMRAAAAHAKNHPDAIKEETLDELNKDTIHSYAAKSEKDLDKKHKELGTQIKANKPVSANKTAAKIGNRQAGLDRAEDRLNKEELELDEVSVLHKALNRALSKEKKASPAQVEKNKANWAKNAYNPANKQQGDTKVNKEELELDEADKISTAQMGHAGKTTIKHIKNPDVTQRMAAHDVKSYADRIALLKDAKRKGNLKEEEMNEELHPDADKVLKHIKPEHHAKYTPDLTTKHYTGNYADRTAVLKAAEHAGHLKESAFDWKNAPREKWDKTKTSTYHDVKKISTGTVYTKQFDKDGTSKGTGDDAAKKAEGAAKRGRGRPKKDKFAESVEILMSLSEEQFDSMMEDGFDTFFEAYEQLDEASKAALKSCGKSTK